MAVTCCDYFDIICAAGISHWPCFFLFLGTIGHPKKNKVGRLLKDDREICSSRGFFPHDFCVHGLSDEPNCRVNSLGNSCDDGYLWIFVVEFGRIYININKYIYIYNYIYLYQYKSIFYIILYAYLQNLSDSSGLPEAASR